MIPAVFAVGEAVSHEARDLQFTKSKDKLSVDCKIRGVSFRGVETADDHEKYAFVIRNKTSGKLKVVVRQPLLFRPFKEDKEASKISTKASEVSRTSLVEAFGSGKKLRAMRERREREAVAGSASQAEAVVSAVTKNSQENRSTSSDGTDLNSGPMLPKLLNARALHPAEVYDIDALAPGMVRTALTQEAEELAGSSMAQRHTWQVEDTYPAMVLNRLRHLPVEPEARSSMAVELALLHYMLLLRKTPASALRTASPLKDFPAAVAQFLLRTYTLWVDTPTRRVRCCPNWMKDKQMYHILVLILHLDHYKTDISELTTHLKMSVNRMVKFFQALGCKIEVDKAADKKFAVLKTPVTFQEQRFRK